MDVFISYSSIEYDTAKHVRDVLEKNNITTWMAPESIKPGVRYTEAIPKGINECTVFLIIGSRNAQRSQWVLSELERAFKSNKVIIPLIIEKFEMTDEFDFLTSRWQRIPAFKGKTKAFEELVSTVKFQLSVKSNDTNMSTNYVLNTAVQEASVAEKEASPKGTSTVHQSNEQKREKKKVKKHADGKIIFSNGTVYEGEKRLGKPHGYGKYTFANGDVYEGELKKGHFHGQGKYTYASGCVYEGDFVEDKFHGHGKMTWIEGVYKGDFVLNKRTGKGKFIWRNGDSYEGDFVDGVCTGKGKFTYANGNIYEGECLNNQQHGYGKYTFTNGKIKEGIFENGLFVEGDIYYVSVDGKRYNEQKFKNKLFFINSIN